MGTEGLEPSRTITRQRILSPSCLPIPPRPLDTDYYIIILNPIVNSNGIEYFGGGTQIRTGDRGFAIHCLTTWPYHQFFLI